MITFGHENLRVSNLENSIRFYEENFDMTVRKRLTGGDGAMAWLDYGTGGFFLELTEAAVARGNDHIAFVTDERERFFARHSAAGLVDTEIPELGIYFMHDLDGNSIEVMPTAALAALQEG
jgi:catechol 2,3-dioxygenase-like lactoylglutathione lyase family enzyme